MFITLKVDTALSPSSVVKSDRIQSSFSSGSVIRIIHRPKTKSSCRSSRVLTCGPRLRRTDPSRLSLDTFVDRDTQDVVDVVVVGHTNLVVLTDYVFCLIGKGVVAYDAWSRLPSFIRYHLN